MINITKDKLEKLINKKGYKWYQNELNIIGIRNSDVGNVVTNKFDDWITVTYRVNGEWVCHVWEATTDPGRKAMVDFSNPNGVARLVPNQYVHSWSIGKHQGKYLALRQIAPVKVFRDKNKNQLYDATTIQEGLFGINIHKAGRNSVLIEDWSEGCQVFKKTMDFDLFMKIAKSNGVDKFTYTLVESKELV
jgi:hypothetical protein